jgi:hypothetical protein
MEDSAPKEINFLTKPLIDPKKLKYVVNSKKVYANLYEIFLTKTITLYQYPFKVDPEIEAGDVSIRQIIQRSAYRELKSIYGEFIISGDSLFGINKIEEMKNVLAVVYLRPAPTAPQPRRTLRREESSTRSLMPWRTRTLPRSTAS